MMLSLICVLSCWVQSQPQSQPLPQALPQPTQAAQARISVRFRTLDAQGLRLRDCAVSFVRSDVPGLRFDPTFPPMVVRSNDKGQVFAKLPGGHAWKVYAYKRLQKGWLSTELLDLSTAVQATDLILEKPMIRGLIVQGLRGWRTALPTGLSLRIEPWGVSPVPVDLPLLGGERIDLPPMPRGSFSVALVHEDFGTVERVMVHPSPGLESGKWPGLVDGVFTAKLEQPVQVAGKILGAENLPVAGAIVRLLTPDSRQRFSGKVVRTDPKGQFRMWFPWRRGSSERSAPQLLISAPGHLLRLESLQDLCQWIDIKTRKSIDPKMFEGLDMARKRVIRLDAAHRLDWTVKNWKASDRFFLRLQLPRNARNPKSLPSYNLPVPIHADGRLELPGDLLVSEARDKLAPYLRGKEQGRGFELCVVRESHAETLFFRAPKAGLPQQKIFDLEDRKHVTFQIEATGKPVLDAKIQVVKAVQGFPLISAPRQLGAGGSIQVPLDEGTYWVLARSDRKGMLLWPITVDAESPERIVMKLEPYYEIRVLTSHPDVERAVLPLRMSVSLAYDSKLPGLAKYLLNRNSPRNPRLLPKIKKEYLLRVSPHAHRVTVSLSEDGKARVFPARRPRRHPRRGTGSIDLDLANALVIKILWR